MTKRVLGNAFLALIAALIVFTILLPLTAAGVNIGTPPQAPIVPVFEQGYVANLDMRAAQPLSPYHLPTIETVEALALKFGARIEVAVFLGGGYAAFIPVDQSEYVNPLFPYQGAIKPIVHRVLVWAKGTKLPSGHVLKREVIISAHFLAYAYARNPEVKLPGYAEKDCWGMIEAADR